MPVDPMFQNFEKCANYLVVSILVANTIDSMRRFRSVPREEMIGKVYRTVKDRANQTADLTR